MPRRFTDVPPDEVRDATLVARRRARYKFAKDRIAKIVAGDPKFTAEEFAELRSLLAPASDEEAAA